MVLALAAGCGGSEEREGFLFPSLQQLRYNQAELPEGEDMPIIPDARTVIGVTINSEDTTGYDDDAPPLLLSGEQIEALDDLEDPAALEKHLSYKYETAPGDLYHSTDGDIDWMDVEQGAIADCYLAAAMSAALFADNERTMRDGLIRPINDADGNPLRYAVRFYDAWGRPQDIEVDADLVRGSSGSPTYIRSADSTRGDEEWAIGLVEKAYAQWHGGFDEIGNGGVAGDVLQALTGSRATYRRIAQLSDASIERTISDAVKDNRAVVSCTFGEDDGVDYSGSGVYAWHCYSAHGVSRNDEGELLVNLRNPWGSSEPAGNGEDDGIFNMKADDYRKYYSGLTIGGGFAEDRRAPGTATLRIGEVWDGHAVISFAAPGEDGDVGLATAYDLRVSKEPLTTDNFYSATRAPAPSPQSPGTVESIELADLAAGTTWYVGLRVEDESGNIGQLSNVLEINTAPVAPEPSDTVVVSWDLESGTTGWEASGLFHLSTRWAASPTHSFYMGDESTGTYKTGERVQSDLWTPAIDLSGTTNPKLRWEQKLVVESGPNDKAWLEITGSGDNFGSWTVAWEGTAPTGVKESIEVDLSPWAGESEVYAIWVFDSTDAIDNDFEGWYIDDVRVLD